MKVGELFQYGGAIAIGVGAATASTTDPVTLAVKSGAGVVLFAIGTALDHFLPSAKVPIQ